MKELSDCGAIVLSKLPTQCPFEQEGQICDQMLSCDNIKYLSYMFQVALQLAIIINKYPLAPHFKNPWIKLRMHKSACKILEKYK